jgi:hypothetical protein
MASKLWVVLLTSSIEQATKPFHPELPDSSKVHRRKPAVTFDPEADAAFFYLEYSAEIMNCSAEDWARLMKVSHGVNPTSTYGLDADGGLVWIRIPTADVTGPPEGGWPTLSSLTSGAHENVGVLSERPIWEKVGPPALVIPFQEVERK